MDVGSGKEAKQSSTYLQKNFGRWGSGVRLKALLIAYFLITSAISHLMGEPIATPSSC